MFPKSKDNRTLENLSMKKEDERGNAKEKLCMFSFNAFFLHPSFV